MKMSRILTAIALVLVLVLTITSCDLFPVETEPSTTQKEEVTTTPTTPTEPTNPDGPGGEPPVDHACESKCETCGLCLDADCTEDVCASKCAGHGSDTPEGTTPVITVVPEELEINAGDDIDLMFGVTVTDSGDEEVRVIIEDDSDFDNTVEGVYTITYFAVNKYGNEATATRTVIVNKALSALSLEVQKNLLGETKWTGCFLNFKNSEYKTLNASATFDKQSGVFYNASESEITVTVSNSDYAVVAIITANGVVIEGRDGANRKIVNAANPIRTSSSATIADINSVAEDMKIPAGGYAIVVQNGYAGDGVDADGRGFMNYNVIGTYGNVVRLLWADSQEVLTPYVDQAPVISGHTNMIYAAGADYDLNTKILEGVKATDDNGTFDIADDVTLELSVTNDGGFDIGVAGEYTITLEATDGTYTTTVTRVVEVTTNAFDIVVDGNTYTTVESLVAIDKDIYALGKNVFVIYTPNYKGGLNWTNGWGEAFVINQYGEVVRIYDGANGKYYDLENPAGIVDSTKCTAGGYLTEAFNSRQDGEYLLIAPNGTAGNSTRQFLLDNRTIGAKVVIPGITFAHKCESVCIQCGLCLNAECTESACTNKCGGHVHNCEDLCKVCAKCTSDCTDEVCAAKCDCVTVVVGEKFLKVLAGTIAIDVAAPTVGSCNFIVYTYAFKAENETLSWTNKNAEALILNQYGQVVRVYDGISNGGKYFDAANRAGIIDTSVANTLEKAYASLSEGEVLLLGPYNGINNNAGRQFIVGVRVIGLIATIPGVTFEALPEHACESACADCGKCMDATCIMPACLAQCACHRCESICAKCEGCLDLACTEKACETKCSCHDCVNFCATCGGCKNTECENDVCAKKCVCTPSLEETGKYLAINGTYFYAETFYYNEVLTANTANTRQLIIYDKKYTGDVVTNGYGVAMVFDENGVFIKAYTWDGIYKLGQEKKAIDYAQADGSYSARAWSELKNGETLVIFANGATTNPSDARKYWALPLCSTALGKTAVLTGYKFGQMAAHECESVCNQCGHCLDAECTEEACANKCAGHEVIVHTCESVCAKCNGCLDAECVEEACATKCGCFTVKIGAKEYVALPGMWAINTEITTSNAATKAVWVFDKSYTGNFSTNGYGVAVVLDKFGRVIEVYDGANGGYWLPAGKQASAHFTTATYATVAWSELQEGETLLVFPNGPDGNKARQIGLDCRYLFNQKMSLTGITFVDTNMTITIGSKTYTATEGKWLYNTAVTTSNAANYAIVIFDKNFTGEFTTNGYGVAVVLDAEGKVARVYDGANGGYWLPTGKQASAHFNVNTYATVAWSELQEGETLVILPNGGSEGNAARQVGLDCRSLFGQKMSITGFTFA